MTTRDAYTVGIHGALRLLRRLGLETPADVNRAVQSNRIPAPFIDASGRQRFNVAVLRRFVDTERRAQYRRDRRGA